MTRTLMLAVLAAFLAIATPTTYADTVGEQPADRVYTVPIHTHVGDVNSLMSVTLNVSAVDEHFTGVVNEDLSETWAVFSSTCRANNGATSSVCTTHLRRAGDSVCSVTVTTVTSTDVGNVIDTPVVRCSFGNITGSHLFTVTESNSNGGISLRHSVQVWRTLYLHDQQPITVSAVEVETVFNDWVPFLVFTAAALWGWIGRNLFLAIIGSVGMLGVFVLPLWSTPVIVLFGVLAIWADYFAHYGKRRDQQVKVATPDAGLSGGGRR